MQGHYKSVRREKSVLERNLAAMRSGNVMNQALNSDAVQRRTFVSSLDANMDTFTFQAPTFVPNALDYTLVVYLHGMGSNYMEPFVTPADQTVATALMRDIPRVGLLSCSYRKDSSWGSDAAMADIIQNTRQVLQEYPFKSIVVMGTSMGGCVALNFAATAPEDIKQKIIGVVSMESSGDLIELFKTTAHRDIRPAMMIAFGGTPDQIPDVYRRKSFLTNIGSLPQGAKVYILSARGDKIVPAQLQKSMVEELKKRSIPVLFEETDGQHQFPSASFYAKGLNFVLGRQ